MGSRPFTKRPRRDVSLRRPRPIDGGLVDRSDYRASRVCDVRSNRLPAPSSGLNASGALDHPDLSLGIDVTMSLGRKFGVLWSASALSNVADGIAFVSMPLLAASMTDDPRLVAGLATLYALVRLLVALPIGVWVDRIDRRTLMVTANLLRDGD